VIYFFYFLSQLDSNDPYFHNLGELEIQESDEGVAVEERVEDLDDENVQAVGEESASDGENKPYVGLDFHTLEEAYAFYNNYACRIGFSVRKASRASSSKGVSSIRFTCHKEGFSNYQKKREMSIGSSTNQRTPEKQKGIIRMGCKASCRIKLVKGNIWQVSVFVEEHNHDLVTSPSKKRNLRSQKRLTEDDKDTIRNLSAQNVRTSQILEYMAVQYGGKQNLRFKKKDVSNHIVAENRRLLGVDVDTTLMYFQKKQEDDAQFFYTIEPDHWCKPSPTLNFLWHGSS
jgi:zinc finger SWIM domain-containing protein 3